MLNKKPANWTEVHSVVSSSGVKRSFYFSDKGALKITRHTDKGEQIVLMTAGVALEDLKEIMPESELVQSLYAMHQDNKASFADAKLQSQAQAKVARQVQKAAQQVTATRDLLQAQGFTAEQINALFGIKAS